jgi:hypothetical protein
MAQSTRNQICRLPVIIPQVCRPDTYLRSAPKRLFNPYFFVFFGSMSACRPIFQAAAHDLDPVAALGSALVMLDGTTARLPAGDAGLYPFVFQRISETVGIVAPVSRQPFCLRQAAQQSGCTRAIADLTCGHAETARTPIGIGIGDGMQLRVYAAFGSADQTALRSLGLPFSTSGSSPCGAPSGKSRRSSPTSEQRLRQPDHPSFGRR